MNKRLNICKVGLLTFILSVGIFGCSEDIMDRINEDTNHTKDTPAKFTLTDVIVSSAFYNVGGDLNTYLSAYIEHEVGTHNQLYRAEYRNAEPSSSSTFDNVWNNLYKSLKNAKMVKARCSDGGAQEGNDVTKGIAEVLIALNSAIITDMFGDVPYTEAAEPVLLPTILTPRIDNQDDIYVSILGELDDAITDLQGNDDHPSGGVGEYDLLYGGDKALWTKLAYGLKARYTMRLLYRSANPEVDLQNVIGYVDRSFASASEQAAFNIYSATNLNPLFDFQWSRDALAASESMFNLLDGRNDPRLRRAFVTAGWAQITGADDPSLNLAPNGANNEVQYYYNTSIFVYSQTASTQLLSYHEIQFLKAEALCRLNRANEARPILKDAFVTAVANMEASVTAALTAPAVLEYGGIDETTSSISTTEAEQYFDDVIDPLFTADPLRETMIQKYIAFFGASGESPEAYNDYRRLSVLGENFITLANPGRFPLRAPYGVSDVTANPNVEAVFGDGQYVYSENVWWAGGTR